MDQSQPATTTSAGAIPDLVKIKPIQSDQTIDVQTSILEPIISNDRFVKFQFDNKGILHSNSKIRQIGIRLRAAPQQCIGSYE